MVIDANIVKEYYQEAVLELQPQLTASTLNLFEKLERSSVFIDEGGHIIHEWSQVAEPEWFTAWYADLLINDILRIIDVEKCLDLKKRLSQLGFPLKGGDFWYIRTAKTVANAKGHALLITEDVDFYDPTKKSTNRETRLNTIKSDKSPIVKYLRKEENILPICMENYYDSQ